MNPARYTPRMKQFLRLVDAGSLKAQRILVRRVFGESYREMIDARNADPLGWFR